MEKGTIFADSPDLRRMSVLLIVHRFHADHTHRFLIFGEPRSLNSLPVTPQSGRNEALLRIETPNFCAQIL